MRQGSAMLPHALPSWASTAVDRLSRGRHSDTVWVYPGSRYQAQFRRMRMRIVPPSRGLRKGSEASPPGGQVSFKRMSISESTNWAATRGLLTKA